MYIVYLLIVVLLIFGIIGNIEDAIKSKKLTREVISYILGIIGGVIVGLYYFFS